MIFSQNKKKGVKLDIPKKYYNLNQMPTVKKLNQMHYFLLGISYADRTAFLFLFVLFFSYGHGRDIGLGGRFASV